MKTNVQLGEKEGHVNVGANSQDCEVQGNKPTQALVAKIKNYNINQLYQREVQQVSTLLLDSRTSSPKSNKEFM
jgi:hypothetical protein